MFNSVSNQLQITEKKCCLPVSTSAMSIKWSSEADANILPSWLKLRVLTGQSNLQNSQVMEGKVTLY